VSLKQFWLEPLLETISDNNSNNRFTALCPGLRGWAGTRRNTHPPTILIITNLYQLLRLLWSTASPCSNCVLRNLFAQPLSMSFLVYLLVWRPPPHIPYISSLNQYLLFTTHAYTTNSVKALKASVSHNTQNYW